MKNYILIIYPLLLCVTAFYKARLSPRGEVSLQFLSSGQAGQIRAAACICIILHHLTQQLTSYGSVFQGPITFFNYAGFLFTGIFFFFSGYGLITSLHTKKDYLITFPWRRFPSVLFPFWITNLLLLLASRPWSMLKGDLPGTLRDLFGLTLVNSNGWFIVEIVLFYLFFYLLFRWSRHPDVSLFLLCLTAGILICYSFFQGHDTGNNIHWFRGEWWYNSTIIFVMGLLCARFRRPVTDFCRKHLRLLLFLTPLLYVCIFGISIWAVIRFGYYNMGSPAGRRGALFTLLTQMLSCFFFTSFLLLLNMKITLHSRILTYLNGISLELFLIHGSFVSLFRNIRMAPLLRYAVVLSVSIGCASLLSPPIKWIVRLVTSFLQSRLYRETPAYHTLESELARQKREKRLRLLRIAVITAIPVILLFLWVTFARQTLFAGKEYKEECEAIRHAEVGDEVFFGYFETDGKHLGRERLPWILVRKEGDIAWLLCRDGIAGSFYHQKHEEIAWEDSDLRAFLNSRNFTGIFSRYELESIVPENGDYLSLLGADEARELFPDDRSRELAITSAAQRAGTNINVLSKDHNWDMKGYRSSWWWLRGETGIAKITAPIVTEDGAILTDKKAVNKPNGAVRPLIRVSVTP